MPDGQLNISSKISITLEESAFGCEKTILVDKTEKCNNCNGTGQIQDTNPCPHCLNNAKELGDIFNFYFGDKRNSKNCVYCGGKGWVEKYVACGECNGAGIVNKRKSIQLKIPAGVDDGQTISLRGEGNEDRYGNKGNALFQVSIEKHKLFSREGNNILLTYEVDKRILESGGEIVVPTLSGKVKFTIPANTKTNQCFRLKGKGIKHISSAEIGDMHVTVVEKKSSESVENLYQQGYSALLRRDKEEAFKYLKKAAERGHRDAQGWLSYCYDMGWGVEKNNKEAFRWAGASYWKDSAVGAYMYGLCFAYGLGVKRDYSESVKLFKKASEEGKNEEKSLAQYELALRYYNGEGTPRNYNNALSLAKQSASAGVEAAKELVQEITAAIDKQNKDNSNGESMTTNNRKYPDDKTEQSALENRLCSKCKKNVWAIYVTKNKNGGSTTENLCFKCAKKLGLKQIDEQLKNIGVSEENIDEMQESLNERCLIGEPIHNKENTSDLAKTNIPYENSDPESVDTLLNELNEMTGLEGVKKQVRTQVALISVEKMAREKGISNVNNDAPSRHMIFTGNPGTGKTTVARLIGKIYAALGVIPKGDVFVECSRNDLVGQYIGQTAQLVNKKVKEAMGGILFIDEAYSLYKEGDNKDFGTEAIDALIQCMENYRKDLIVIMAGYTKEMHHMLNNANPGLKSRVRIEIEFSDYSEEELFSIFLSIIKKQGRILAPEAEELVHDILHLRSRDPSFGNARGVRNLVETITENLNIRLAEKGNFTEEEYSTILFEDVEAASGKGKDSSEHKTLEELMEELNSLIGLTSVKKEVNRRAAAIQVAEMAKKAGVSRRNGVESLHMVFTGNPGTGKTTVARLLGQIYGSLGVLPDGNRFVECSRADLVGQYVGQTAINVKRVVQEALGGILFIDEAYSLYNDGSSNDFGREAIDTLIQCMENNRNNLVVIMAGYTNQMHYMLDHANPGLASRINTEIMFEDYTADEMCKIFAWMVSKNGFSLSFDENDELLHKVFDHCASLTDFGNARGVRNFVDKVMDAQTERIIALASDGRELKKEDYEEITIEDVRSAFNTMYKVKL